MKLASLPLAFLIHKTSQLSSYEGSPVTVTLAAVNMPAQPMGSLGGLETPLLAQK